MRRGFGASDDLQLGSSFGFGVSHSSPSQVLRGRYFVSKCYEVRRLEDAKI